MVYFRSYHVELLPSANELPRTYVGFSTKLEPIIPGIVLESGVCIMMISVIIIKDKVCGARLATMI